MKKSLLLVLVLLIAAAPADRRDLPTLPKSPPPEVVVAEASEKDGAIWVRFWIPVGSPAPRQLTIEKDGKKMEVTTYTISYSRWSRMDLKADGKQVQAFDVEGKEIAPQELPKLLAKRPHVVLFKDDSPDPYYLSVLRPGTVVLKVPQDKLNHPPAADKVNPLPVKEAREKK
jgi:hypothetical protein